MLLLFTGRKRWKLQFPFLLLIHWTLLFKSGPNILYYYLVRPKAKPLLSLYLQIFRLGNVTCQPPVSSWVAVTSTLMTQIASLPQNSWNCLNFSTNAYQPHSQLWSHPEPDLFCCTCNVPMFHLKEQYLHDLYNLCEHMAITVDVTVDVTVNSSTLRYSPGFSAWFSPLCPLI